MKSLRLALDWTPNTNHTGFFVARDLGFYEDSGLNIDLLTPEKDNYALTPAKKLELGKTDLALAPSESVISYRTKNDPVPVKAIGAVLQKDASAVTVIEGKGIKTPSDLEGKTYASYDARYEDEIIRCMIRNDGGSGKINIITPDKLGIWNTLINGNSDATWTFIPWEGAEAKSRGVDLLHFQMEDYGIPYGYSPIILATEQRIEEEREGLINFMKASRKGFEYAIQNPEVVASLLEKYVPEHQLRHLELEESQRMINKYYIEEGSEWGSMKEEKWRSFIDWLKSKDLVDEKIDHKDLYENLI